MYDVKNVVFIHKDAKEDVELFKNSPVIMLDIDPHDGKQEIEIVQKLIDINYKGIVICDDIHLNSEMEYFWSWIPCELEKFDITLYGHFSGTGLLVFDNSVVSVEIQ